MSNTYRSVLIVSVLITMIVMTIVETCYFSNGKFSQYVGTCTLSINIHILYIRYIKSALCTHEK